MLHATAFVQALRIWSYMGSDATQISMQNLQNDSIWSQTDALVQFLVLFDWYK